MPPETRSGSIAMADVGIGGSYGILAEIVDRSEGWVPRFTIYDGVSIVGGDVRFRRASAMALLIHHFRCDESVAEVLVEHAGQMAVRKVCGSLPIGRW